ncbi:hypothetical protein L9F63_010799, partial [Diploptera punctata]
VENNTLVTFQRKYTNILCSFEIVPRPPLKNLETETLQKALIYVCQLITRCGHCEIVCNEIYTSPRLQSVKSSRPPFEVDRKVVSGFLQICRGLSAIEQFSMALLILWRWLLLKCYGNAQCISINFAMFQSCPMEIRLKTGGKKSGNLKEETMVSRRLLIFAHTHTHTHTHTRTLFFYAVFHNFLYLI